jgi:3-oxoacyl-[acyl-carrier-protein] synthase III
LIETTTITTNYQSSTKNKVIIKLKKLKMGAKILKIGIHLPEFLLTNEILAEEFNRWEPSKIESKLGIRERHIAAKNETAGDLAYHACEKILKDYDRQKIDMLILCTQSPDFFLPTTACTLQDRLGLRTDIGAFDFNLGCSGFIYGLAISKSLITSGVATNVLLITSETYSKHINPNDLANRTIFGDGAAAIIIENTQHNKIFEFVLGTDGRGKDNLIVLNGGLRTTYQSNAVEKTNDSGDIYTDNNLFMNGPEIFNFTIDAVPIAVDQCLRKNKISLQEIDFVIFHQANKYIIDYLRKRIGIPIEKFYTNMLNTGNTVSATIPIAYADALKNGQIIPGNKVLLCGFGVGYSWGAVVVEV